MELPEGGGTPRPKVLQCSFLCIARAYNDINVSYCKVCRDWRTYYIIHISYICINAGINVYISCQDVCFHLASSPCIEVT
jgi:hypothetical protein